MDGLKEVVDDGVTGFVVERKNPQAMADKIIELIKSPDLRISMGAAGRRGCLVFIIGTIMSNICPTV